LWNIPRDFYNKFSKARNGLYEFWNRLEEFSNGF
jgi:hypothetical protein